jgi:hypothetical protein
MNGKPPRLILIVTTLLLTGSGFAQQTNSDASFITPAPKKPKVQTEKKAAPAVDQKPAPYDVVGVVQQAFKMKHPLDLVNPLAPKKDGSGQDNVSWDPDNREKPKGIIIFGIQW